MSKYDTHGGYFAPQDSMRINEGGSHEENPNGGVQIGVDEQGIPNMLEEGEPIYKDFVYSDNIKASEKFLEANGIPTKYKDKLYSEIADSFFAEADDRPYDPISRNGLEAMLGRLANAQEEQKQDKERRSLERELKNLSQEELDALEQEIMSVGQAQADQQPVQGFAPEQIEQSVEQMPLEEIPAEQPVMMAEGGKVNRFDDGDDLMFYDNPQSPYMWDDIYKRTRTLPITAGFGLPDAFNPNGVYNGIQINPDHWYHYRTNGKGITNNYNFGDIDLSGYSLYPQSATSDGRERAARSYHVASGTDSVIGSDTRTYPGMAEALARADADILNSINDGVKATEYRLSNPNFDQLPAGPNITLPDNMVTTPAVGLMKAAPETNGSGDGRGDSITARSGMLPTFSRYAGAIGSGILGLYNASQKPDRYTATRLRPYIPTGHINLQNERYMPVDQNMIQNQILAQGNSTQRALRNSGLGPSTAAAILAADNNTTGNIGQGFLQAWQANNQQRNAVLAANNQAEAQRAQYDYSVDAAKQRALQETEWRNAQNDLMLQRLNYQAEADKYNALSNQINAGLEALSGIGRENFIRNQINSNTALNGYKTLGNGVGAYVPRRGYIRECGGKIKK